MEITFPHRFRGPLTSANGGYACGRLASFVDADEVEVTLRLPPPLERPLTVRRDAGSAVLLDDHAVVAEARRARVGSMPRRRYLLPRRRTRARGMFAREAPSFASASSVGFATTETGSESTPERSRIASRCTRRRGL